MPKPRPLRRRHRGTAADRLTVSLDADKLAARLEAVHVCDTAPSSDVEEAEDVRALALRMDSIRM